MLSAGTWYNKTVTMPNDKIVKEKHYAKRDTKRIHQRFQVGGSTLNEEQDNEAERSIYAIKR